MGQRGDIRATEHGETVLIHGLPVRPLALLVSVLRVLQSLSGKFMAGLVVLLSMGLRGAPVRLGREVVQLGGPLVVLVVRSVVVTSRHEKPL
jgi:hypothetical protein